MFKNLINVLNFASSSPTGGGLVCTSSAARRLDDQTARALSHSPTCPAAESLPPLRLRPEEDLPADRDGEGDAAGARLRHRLLRYAHH